MKQEDAAYRVMLEATALLNECGELVVVGGWVPEIHFPKQSHIGSIDVDVVLDPSTFDEGRSLHDHLVAAGYFRSPTDSPTQYFKAIAGHDVEVKLDLLTTPILNGKKVQEIMVGGLKVGSLPGLDLALMSNTLIDVEGIDPDGNSRSVTVKVANPEAFVLIKAFPLDRRKKPKDAYDIAFVLNRHQPSLGHLAGKMAPLVQTDSGAEAYEILKAKFDDLEAEGPTMAAEVAAANGQDYEQARQAAFQDASELLQTLSILVD